MKVRRFMALGREQAQPVDFSLLETVGCHLGQHVLVWLDPESDAFEVIVCSDDDLTRDFVEVESTNMTIESINQVSAFVGAELQSFIEDEVQREGFSASVH